MPSIRRRLHLAVHRALAGRFGVAVLVVERAGAAVLDKIRHGGEGRIEDHLVVHPLEDAVNLVQPLRHGHVGKIDGFQVAYEGLEEMVMRIDQSGVHEHVRRVDHFVAFVRKAGADRKDSGALNQHIRVAVYAIPAVAGHDRLRASDHHFAFDLASSFALFSRSL
jgi:hypothetical protein